ncbi:hypothetical protein IAE29_10055 [Ochrobactrum sp. S46]|nr:hypothetical protein [Ochrobactrum sp. S45]MBK0043674.1 hypothetical protein [Ochrobactrum sp. S46]
MKSFGWVYGFVVTTFFAASAFGMNNAEGATKKIHLTINQSNLSIDPIQFGMDGTIFRVPQNRLDTILESDPKAPDQLFDGFNMVGLGVDFSPRNRDNRAQFSKPYYESQAVNVYVARNCRVSTITPVRPDRCLGSANLYLRYQTMQEPLLGSFLSVPTPSKFHNMAPRIVGMRYAGVMVHEDKANEPRFFLYEQTDGSTNFSFAVCNPTRRAPILYYCSFWSSWRERFNVQLRLPPRLVKNWVSISEVVLESLESFTSSSENTVNNPVLRMRTFP